MIKFQDLRDLLKPLLELLDLHSTRVSDVFYKQIHFGAYLLEVVSKLDNGSRFKHPLLIDDKLSMLKRINVALDEKEVGATLDRKETLAGHVDTVRVLEVLDGSSGSSLQLNNSMAIIGGLGVDDDLQLHAFSLHNILEGFQIDPQIVRVEDLELANCWRQGQWTLKKIAGFYVLDLKSSTCSEGT